MFDENDLKTPPELGSRGSHKVLYNIIEAKQQNYNSTAPVTYATHVTPDFLRYISEIVRYWDGLVSLAAFVPDFDADTVTKLLLTLCQCLPEMSKISVHYVFPKNKPPFIETGLFKTPPNCNLPDPSTVLTYRYQNKLAYPVNVCRNVARNASVTKHILVSDVELIPSENLAGNFLGMLGKTHSTSRLMIPSRVYVVPVFEVETYENIPRSKEEIKTLVKEEKAVYFHRYICSHCQKFPGLERWFLTRGDIKPLLTVRREYPYHRWEPIYIGTKDEPLYSELLSWEGKQDKMTQMLEMCLMGYSFVILDGVFLVHWPGIKRKTYDMRLSNKWRSPFLVKNSRQYNNIVHNLAHKYKRNPKCKVQ